MEGYQQDVPVQTHREKRQRSVTNHSREDVCKLVGFVRYRLLYDTLHFSGSGTRWRNSGAKVVLIAMSFLLLPMSNRIACILR